MQTYTVYAIKKEEVVPTATAMREAGRALIMIHGYVDKTGENVVSYEYDADGGVASYQVRGEKSLPTISHLYDTAAAWPERELNELMGLAFEGLDTSGRLFLPEDILDERGQIVVTPLDELRAHAEGKDR